MRSRNLLALVAVFTVALLTFASLQLRVPQPEAVSKMSPAQQFVADVVKANKVAVFSKSYCPYCHKAKQALLTVLKADQMFIVELDQRNDGDQIQDALQEATGARSVPRVFVDGKFIGGGDDTARMASNGELKQLLIAAGVL